jgi:hypothetical protein
MAISCRVKVLAMETKAFYFGAAIARSCEYRWIA